MARKPKQQQKIVCENSQNSIEDIHLKQKKLVAPKTLTDIKLTEKQKQLIELIDEKDINIITGPSGSSKTFIDCYYAIKSLKERKTDKIILTKPIQEAGEKLGALPGTVEEKIDPHYESYRQNLLNFINKNDLERLIKNESIIYKPLAYLRGTGFKNCLLILDEAQNCTWKQIMLFVTRMGVDSKVIISGDISQHDVKKDMVALLKFSEMIKDIKGVNVFEFTREDIMRHKILLEITERYEKLKYSGKIKEE